MKAIVIFDGKFSIRNGKPVSHHLTYSSFSTRYLDVFDSVVVVGRLFDEEVTIGDEIEGKGVSFVPIPGYSGVRDFLSKFPKIVRVLLSLESKNSVLIYRTPGTVPFIAWILQLFRLNSHYVVEVVADPYDQLSRGTSKHPLRSVFQYLYTLLLQLQCRYASGASYVTEFALQRRYPSMAKAKSHYTSLNLPEMWISSPKFYSEKSEFRIVCTGMMAKLYKGQDILISAIDELRNCRPDLKLYLSLIGDGEYRPQLEDQVRQLGLTEYVTFHGALKHGVELLSVLDQADVFVLPSRQEGLPRAMIEAMARGLPCIGTRVGGIPELLSDDFLVPPNSVKELSAKILELCTDKGLLNSASARNVEKARMYSVSVVQNRRAEFYRNVVENYA